MRNIRVSASPSTNALSEPDHDFVLSQIALAYILKGEAARPLAFASQVSLSKRSLNAGAQTALMMRATSRFLLGQKARR
jgi:hypothetical protein